MRSGILTACIGASRSGKTQFILSEVDFKGPVMVWDVKGEYPCTVRARDRRGLLDAARAHGGKPGVIAFTTDHIKTEFDFFCKVARVWVESQEAAGKNSVLIFEETADVTTPQKAPHEYGVILRRYLSKGVDIYAVTQRPAESDKTAIGNASRLHVCRHNLESDRKATAGNTGLPLKEIQSLIADQDAGIFEYLQADTGKQKWMKGKLTFNKAGRPIFTKTSESFDL